MRPSIVKAANRRDTRIIRFLCVYYAIGTISYNVMKYLDRSPMPHKYRCLRMGITCMDILATEVDGSLSERVKGCQVGEKVIQEEGNGLRAILIR